jgi:hypothetical protein
MAATVSPPGNKQVGHHHDQCRTLRQRLFHAEAQHQQGYRDDAAADPEQPAKKPRAAPSVRVNTSSLSERKGMCRGQQEKTHDIEIPHSYNGLSIT